MNCLEFMYEIIHLCIPMPIHICISARPVTICQTSFRNRQYRCMWGRSLMGKLPIYTRTYASSNLIGSMFYLQVYLSVR